MVTQEKNNLAQQPTAALRLFTPAELIPAAWRLLAETEPARLFNPAILAQAPGYIMAYRVVLPDGLRRLALCRLDRDLGVVPGSQMPLSDFLRLPTGFDYPAQAKCWFAHPRLVVWRNRLLIHWNSGCHEPSNHQFVQELDRDSLHPLESAWELVRVGGQAKFEKNWGIFSHDDDLYCVYSLGRFRILKVSLTSDGRMECTETHNAHWDYRPYVKRFGHMRGGAPPVLADGRYYVFHHSCCRTTRGTRYVAGLLGFAAEAPFTPEVFSEKPLPLANPFGAKFLYEPLNSTVAEVIYPCGAVHVNNGWLVSYGINDEHCAVAYLDHADLLQQLRPVECLAREPPRELGEVVFSLLRGWKKRLQRGTFSDEERQALENYVTVGDLIAILQSKARKLLKRTCGKSERRG